MSIQTEPRRLLIVERRAVPDPGPVLDTDVERAAGYRPLGVTPPKRRPLLDLAIGVAFIVGLALGIGFFGLATAIALWLVVFIPVLTRLVMRDELGESEDAHLEQKRWGSQR